ncbi:MAG: hypothetical protein ACYTAO_01595 [Planctomycetota bacterium]|jgi:hypothetical protein
MNIYESLSSPSFVLNEQIARQVFEVLPERGPLVLIMDRRGNSWPSDSEEFAKLNISESFLKELRGKIDDGAEPVVTQAEDCSIIAAELTTEQGDCGYVIVALPNYSPESTLINIDLIEMLLNQFSLIARLIEKNNLLYEAQMKHYRACGPGTSAAN